jgi:hypothetical protein
MEACRGAQRPLSDLYPQCAHFVLVHSCLASFVSIWKSIRALEISSRCSSDLQTHSAGVVRRVSHSKA